jgi:hypothetical protein
MHKRTYFDRFVSTADEDHCPFNAPEDALPKTPSKLIKGVDPYFGAGPLSDRTLADEFGGHVVPGGALYNDRYPFGRYPSARQSGNLDSFDISPADADELIVFHDNEYEEIKKICLQPIQSNFSIVEQPPSPIGTPISIAGVRKEQYYQGGVRSHLGNNVRRRRSRGKFEDIIYMVDDEFSRELDQRIRKVPPANQEDATQNPTEMAKLVEDSNRWRRTSDDLYTPRWIRGKGAQREGLCEIC